MIKIKFLTFGEGHLVSDREFARLKKGFAKVDMELVRDAEDYDLIMVKGFSHTWQQVVENNPLNKKVVYYSIGTEWKVGASPDLNEPIRELYERADAIVHISEYCKDSHYAILGQNINGVRYRTNSPNEHVIIPAEEPKLPSSYPKWAGENRKLKLATTAIPRPVKRIDQLEELCKKYDIELVPAWGGVSDFSYYHDCDGYITIPRKEGMPNNVLEAIAYGLPCIVTNYGGAKEAVGDAGIIIKNDPDNVAWDPSNILPVDEILFEQAIHEFKRKLPELRIKVRERVLSELNDYVCACKFKEVFTSLL